MKSEAAAAASFQKQLPLFLLRIHLQHSFNILTTLSRHAGHMEAVLVFKEIIRSKRHNWISTDTFSVGQSFASSGQTSNVMKQASYKGPTVN